MIEMSKNMSIYIPAELAEKMNDFAEVNWSEIVRVSIEDYVLNRHKSDNLFVEISQKINEFNAIKQEFTANLNRQRDELGVYDFKDKQICKYAITYYPERKIINILFNIENDLFPFMRLDRIIYDFRLVSASNGKEVLRLKDAYLKKRRVRQYESIQAEINYDIDDITKNVLDELFEKDADAIEIKSKAFENSIILESEIGNMISFLMPWDRAGGRILRHSILHGDID